MMTKGARARLGRRNFLGWVSSSLPITLAACNDEPIVFTAPDDRPPGSIDYGELMLQYFGEDGLDDDPKGLRGRHQRSRRDGSHPAALRR